MSGTRTLNPHQTLIVQLLDAGFTRWRIAQLTGRYQDEIRNDIFDLCATFDCNTARLPDAVRARQPLDPLTTDELVALLVNADTLDADDED